MAARSTLFAPRPNGLQHRRLVDPPISPTRSRLARITGRAAPGLTVVITNGQAVHFSTVAAAGTFERQVTLRENFVNRLYASVVDQDQVASAPVLVSVIEDEQAPSLHVDEPVDGSSTVADSMVIAGRVADLLSGFLGLAVTVNGEPAQVVAGIGTNGTFERNAVPLQPGLNAVTVEARDAVGNVTTRSISVERRAIPDGAARLFAVSGDGQQGRIHEPLPVPVSVQALRGDGSPWPRKLITFEVTRSDGRLSPVGGQAGEKPLARLQTRTDDQGIAQVRWLLGSDAGCGNNRLRAKGEGLLDVVRFCASAAPGPAAQINVGSGNMLRAEAGGPSPEPLRAWVSDGCNGIGGVPVTFEVTRGGGQVNGQSQVVVPTSPTGHAAVDFVLGPTGGNNVVAATFAGNLTAPAVFTVHGVERLNGEPTSFSGLVLDNSNQPIGGATCLLFVPGYEPIRTVSVSDGPFRFDEVAGSGASILRVEGATATRLGGADGKDVPPGSFPFLFYMVTVIPNAENSLIGPVLLPPLDPANRRRYDGTEDVVLEMAGVEGIRMKVKAGSMRLPDGSLPSPEQPAFLSLDQVHHDDVPMPMNDGAAPQLAWTLQPGGATFDPPVEVTYPNLSGLPPGAIANFLSFNHDTHRFEIVSSGHVTADGSSIVTDPGSGLTLAGWGCNCPPYSVTGKCKTCRVLSVVADPRRPVSPWEPVTLTAITDPSGRPVTFYGGLAGATTFPGAGGDEINVFFNSTGKKEVHAQCGTQSSGPYVIVQVVELAEDIVRSPNPKRYTYCQGEDVEHEISLTSAVAGMPIDVDLVAAEPGLPVVESKSVTTDGSGKARVKFVPPATKRYYVRAKLKNQPSPTPGEAFFVIDFEKGKAELEQDGEDDAVFSADPQSFCERMSITGRYKPPMGEDLTGTSIAWEIAEVGGAASSISLKGAEFRAQGPFLPGKWKVTFYCDRNQSLSRDAGEPEISTDFEVREMKVYPLTVFRHLNIPATDAEIALTLGDASFLMQQKDTQTDERCCVDLTLAGSVAAFNGISIITNEAEFDVIMALGANVKIVDKILWCGDDYHECLRMWKLHGASLRAGS